MSRYTVNGNGTLNGTGTTTVGSDLRSLAVSPDGQNLFAGSSGDGKIYSFRIDSSDGSLTAPATASPRPSSTASWPTSPRPASRPPGRATG